MGKDNKTTKWHSPIYRGLQLDLLGNDLEFQDEIQLSEEALIIDAVVIKKENHFCLCTTNHAMSCEKLKHG